MDYTEYRVIFHIDERSKWKLLLGNVENLLQAADSHDDCQSITVEVLANSEAVLEYAPARSAAVTRPKWPVCIKGELPLPPAGMQ